MEDRIKMDFGFSFDVISSYKLDVELSLKSDDFSFCVELPIKARLKNLKLLSLASHERSRIAGIKKVNEFKDGFLILISILKLLIFKKWKKKLL